MKNTKDKTVPLRDSLQNEIRQMLIRQTLPAGSRIVESELSSRLGVSRTPVREALFKLEQEGFVRSDLACGFRVNPLKSQEVRELYPVIWTLEGLAVRLSNAHLLSVVKELKSINQELRKAVGSPVKIIRFDTLFHQKLTQECRNRYLINQLVSLRQLVLRYEFAYMQDSSWVSDSIEQHKQMIEAIAEHDFDRLIDLIEQNWRFGMDRISTWLDWIQAEDNK